MASELVDPEEYRQAFEAITDPVAKREYMLILEELETVKIGTRIRVPGRKNGEEGIIVKIMVCRKPKDKEDHLYYFVYWKDAKRNKNTRIRKVDPSWIIR